MILDEMSSPSTGTAAGQEKAATNAERSPTSIVISKNNGAADLKTSTTVTASAGTQTLSAINNNTFVVKLEPPPENGAANHSAKTNLLQLFGENGKGKNLSVVGRIVVNRALLKNAKNKQTVTSKPQITASNSFGSKLKIGLTKSSIVIRTSTQTIPVNGKENKECPSDKKDDEISGNLAASFMNFKFTGLVPPPVKTECRSVGTNTFKINLKPPGVRLPPSKQTPSSPVGTPEKEMNTRPSDPVDDDLTSLSWLTSNDKNLLKTIRSCNPDDAGISLSGDDSEFEEESDLVSNKSKAVFTAKSKVECGSQGFATRQFGQPYSPNGKPPYSFSCLIFMAVEDSADKMLPVKEIYAWVCKHFPYFQTAPPGWKNSIRHNLSLNKCFKKVDLGKHSHDPGKGSLWCIDPAYRPNLIQALKRTPFYPYLYPSGIGQPLSLNNLASLLPGVKSGKIPLWSPSMTQPTSSWADPDVASAALNLMGLKGKDAIDSQSPSVRSTIQELAAEIFKQNDDVAGTIPLVISDPADDHTYSSFSFGKHKDEIVNERCHSPESDKSAPDAAYEFETPGTDLESDVDVDEPVSVGDSDEDCDLGDSGFAGMKGNQGTSKLKKTTKSSHSVGSKSKRSKFSSKSAPSKKGLKVRFQTKKKMTASPAKRRLKRKITPPDEDDAHSSDADSGKDSPKVQSKSKRRTPAKASPPPTKKAKNKPYFKPPAHISPYGTRSSKQTRHSRRIGNLEQENVLERASARKRKQDYTSADTDDEEIKLAAGSLLHLKGFRSPP